MKSHKVDDVLEWLAVEIRGTRAKLSASELIAAFDRAIKVLEQLTNKVGYIPVLSGKAKRALVEVKRVRLGANAHFAPALNKGRVWHRKSVCLMCLADYFYGAIKMNVVTKSGMPVILTLWRKVQAAMLYHFTSIDYLQGLHKLVRDLVDGLVDPLRETARAQGRDKALVSEVWGDRNTVRNWENNAWPFLKDLQVSLARDIALRMSGHYRRTSVNESLRGLAEYSTEWATPEEERVLQAALATISEYAARYDKSVDVYQNRWNDYHFADLYPAFASLVPKVPKFQVREEITASTGKVPSHTGVYVAVDDQHATLQFVWSAPEGIKLRAANTFNELGLAALSSTGRRSLWFDQEKMFAFATAKQNIELFHDAVYLYDEPYPSLAAEAVAARAFTARSCRWAFVEIVPNEFEELVLSALSDAVQPTTADRVAAGDRFVRAGYYFAPAAPRSRQLFSAGVIAPSVNSSYGKTFWQWDPDQTQ